MINQKKVFAREVVAELKRLYPEAECALRWEGEPWRLMVLACLSAQCTDARVNAVSRPLFERFPDPAPLAAADLDEIEGYIRSCGLFRTKAKNIRESCALLVSEYGGVIPREMDKLLRFPGVGRKVANLLLGDIYGIPGIVADTHCIRICGRLGFYGTEIKDPAKVERILSELVEPAEQSDFCHRLVLFGREWCSARSPRCGECPMRRLCGAREEAMMRSEGGI